MNSLNIEASKTLNLSTQPGAEAERHGDCRQRQQVHLPPSRARRLDVRGRGQPAGPSGGPGEAGRAAEVRKQSPSLSFGIWHNWRDVFLWRDIFL